MFAPLGAIRAAVGHAPTANVWSTRRRASVGELDFDRRTGRLKVFRIAGSARQGSRPGNDLVCARAVVSCSEVEDAPHATREPENAGMTVTGCRRISRRELRRPRAGYAPMVADQREGGLQRSPHEMKDTLRLDMRGTPRD